MIDSSSLRAFAGSVPSEVFVAQGGSSLLLETRCGVLTLHPLLNAASAAVLAIAQVCLSYVLNLFSISTDCVTSLPAGRLWREDTVEHSPTESRRVR
jgi:hypothetical protein